ncbi:hypothetical protein Glove_23g249 [Diversispora epigaea]|uniref:Uncharacterized protein n=1 Tax=Diversispora epigaea TaxID=1348612 RepID=A0A397JKC6_9GLOM|nr:hypothetical protein Glove_23g249 [Diversispora epigaea]
MSGIEWVIPATNDIIHNIEFRCTMEQFLSSTKVEIMAMLTAIAIAPTNSQQIIQDLGVQISLFKVKAHSGVKFNEIADRLAQVSITSPFQDSRISINNSALNQIKTIPMWNIYMSSKLIWS